MGKSTVPSGNTSIASRRDGLGHPRRHHKSRSRSPLHLEPTLLSSSSKTNTPRPTIIFPFEITELVADFLFELRSFNETSSMICSVKPPWLEVAGFINTSTALRRIGLIRWMKVLTIKSSDDWSHAQQYSGWVRELNCLDGSLVSPYHRQILLDFTYLHTISIDAHRDVIRNGQNQFSYRDLFVALPPSLRRLELTRAHGPDARVIATVKKYCPNLEELRLGRCTMFNSPSACDFWSSFPHDHDSYMSNQNTDTYARSLAQELTSLVFLKSLRLGLYLVPSATVLVHRLYHRNDLPAPAVTEWQQNILEAQVVAPDAYPPVEPTLPNRLVSLLHTPDTPNEFGEGSICSMCIGAVESFGKSAETKANEILKELVPSLEKVQWMGWLTPGHLGMNYYDFTSTA